MSLNTPRCLSRMSEKYYCTFRHGNVTPISPIDEINEFHFLELFCAPSYTLKDVALQFVLIEYFPTRKNEGKTEDEREILTVVGATSGDTDSAAIQGLIGKKDGSV